MVNITNGKKTLMVTRGAYESTFKPLGYKLMGTKSTKSFKAPETAYQSATEGFKDDVPVSQWSKDDIKAYADRHGLDLSGAKTIRDAKNIVLNHQKAEH